MIKNKTLIIVSLIYLAFYLIFVSIMLAVSFSSPRNLPPSSIQSLATDKIDKVVLGLEKRTVLPAPEATDLSQFTFGNSEPFK